MHHRAQHKSRIKLEHDLHMGQVEPKISNYKNESHDSNMKILECVRWPANKITMRECFEAKGTQELPQDHQFKKPQPCPHHSFRKFEPVKTRAVHHNTPTEKDLDLWPHSSTAVKQQSSKAATQQSSKATKHKKITETMLIFYVFNEISMIFIDFHMKSIENQRKSWFFKRKHVKTLVSGLLAPFGRKKAWFYSVFGPQIP